MREFTSGGVSGRNRGHQNMTFDGLSTFNFSYIHNLNLLLVTNSGPFP